MSNPFTSPTLSGYNANPPSDDGAQTANNTVTWAKHLQKIGDPLKTQLASLVTNTSSAFDSLFGNNVVSKSTNYTVASSDQGALIKCTAAITITLPSATTVGNNWIVAVKNAITTSGVVTVDGNASETIDGQLTLVLHTEEDVILVSDGSNWVSLIARPKIMSTTVAKTGAYSAVYADWGTLFLVTNSTTITLPSVSSVPQGYNISVKNNGSGTVTVDGATSELINGATTQIVSVGAVVTVVSDGSAWHAFFSKQAYELIDIQIFETLSTGVTLDTTWTRPIGCTAVEVWVVGGGGGGGGSKEPSVSGTNYASGGGGAAMAYAFITSGLSATENVRVGAGGAAGDGATPSAGSDGTASYFGDFSGGDYVLANDGDGGAAASSTTGGRAGGNGSAGTGTDPTSTWTGAVGYVVAGGLGERGFGGMNDGAGNTLIMGGLGGASGFASAKRSQGFYQASSSSSIGAGIANNYGEGGAAGATTNGSGTNVDGSAGRDGIVIVKSYR